MMLGTSSSSLITADAAAAAAAAAAEAHDSGGGSTGGSGEVGGAVPGGGGSSGGGGGGEGFSDEEKGSRIINEEVERGGSGGNRWPRQETLALLKIRTEMGVAFRDSSLKGPLWEEVSRKMAELGFQRSAKKCKEKFENVYKYHKRTKEGRASKPDGKTYRFFDQLEALENSPSLHILPPQSSRQLPVSSMAAVPLMPATVAATATTTNPHVTVSSPNPVSFSPSVNLNPIMSSSLPPSQLMPAAVTQPTTTNNINPLPQSNNNNNSSLPLNLSGGASLLSDSTSSSSTSSDEDFGRRHNKRRKRKYKDFFERLMKEVIDKQEDLQRKFLETLEKRERDRMIREEAWRVQEMARMNRELDLLAQERSMAAAKDTAVMQFLHKITAGNQPNQITPSLITTNVVPPPVVVHHHLQPPENPSPQPISVSLPPAAAAPPATTTTTPPAAAAASARNASDTSYNRTATDNNGGGGDHGQNNNFMMTASSGGGGGGGSSSRWPKTEVQALIRLRTNLDMKYQENGPKGPLWEEISAGMNKIGYSRSAKRCKEKWENINKYFKKVKESNKKRPEDSKTCPYFQQLEALYKEKAKADHHHHHLSSSSYAATTNSIKPENPLVPIMARPEQQWPLLPPHQQQQEEDTAVPMDQDHDTSDNNIDQNDHHQDDEDDEDVDDVDDEDEEEDDEEGGGGGYEIVTNKASSAPKTAAE